MQLLIDQGHNYAYSGPSLIRTAWDQTPFGIMKGMNNYD